MQDVIKLIPPTKDYIWGGNKLKTLYGLGNTGKVAEGWMLSFHRDGECTTESGQKISEAVPRKLWGKACEKFEFFPSLVKLIDAADNLSVQVHPSDEYALKNEGQYGKTEMWYIVGADSGAGIYLGFKRDITKEEYRNAIEEGKLADLLNFIPVHKGECYFIKSGTVHAIGKGCLIAEVQQNSNLTYRVFDYNRVGADGKPRQLHIEKAIEVSDLKKYEPTEFGNGVLASCPYFTARIVGEKTGRNDESYTSLVVLEGEGALNGKKIAAGKSYFVPAGVGYEIKGKVTVLETVTQGY